MRHRILAIGAMIAFSQVAIAQEDKKTDDDKPADPDTGESTIEEKTLGLLPNPFQKYGVKFAATYIGESLGNVSGGLKEGCRLRRPAQPSGRRRYAKVGRYRPAHLSRQHVSDPWWRAVTGQPSEPVRGQRHRSATLDPPLRSLFREAVGQQASSLKAGQLAADSEFFNTKYTDVLTNASMGWPAITSTNLPSGGPSPPLAAMGARVLINVTEQLSLLGGIFDGNQAGPGPEDPQLRNRYGVNFRVNDPPLLLGQLQYAWNNKKGDPNLAGQIKVGGWRHFGDFPDQRYASNGVSLAAPTSSGEPLQLLGDIGGWGVFEQQIYRVPNSDDRGIGIFGRISGAPADRNLIDLYADAGVEFIGLSDKRPDDKFGIAAGYAHISKRAQQLDGDYRTFVSANWPQRSFEGLVTAVYQYQVRDGWTVQPNFQYIIHPGGGATNPSGPFPGRPLKNAAVLGLRTTLKF